MQKTFRFWIEKFAHPRVLSFALNRLWIYILFFSIIPFEPLLSASSVALDQVYLSSITVLVFVLALCGVFHHSVSTLLEKTWGRFLGPLLAAVGTLTTSLVSPMETSLAFTSLCALLTGTGSALLLIDIGRAYGRVGGRRAGVDAAISFLISALLFPLFFLLPHYVALFATALLPVLAALVIHVSNQGVSNGENGQKIEYPSIPTALPERIKPTALLKLGISAGIFGTAVGFMRDIYARHGAVTFDGEYALLLLIATIIAATFVGIFTALSKNFRLEFLYRPVLLICATGFLATPLLGTSGPIPFIIISIGYTLFELLIWIILSELTHRFSYSAVQVFGIGSAIARGVGLLPGVFLSRFILDGVEFDSMTLMGLSLVMICSFIVAYSFIFTEKDVEVFNESANKALRSTQKIPLKQKCKLVGAYYGLSPREIEVFHLLALGRNAARIREELIISEGTANTHLRNVYQKLGVHSHQEIIDLIQGVDVDELIGPKDPQLFE